MRQWHYSLNSEKLGPIPQDQLSAMLNSGQLPPDAYVWTSGMENWTHADLVEELRAARAMPPPIPAGEPKSAETKETSKIATTIASIVGAAIGFFAVKALPMEMSIQLFAGAIVGCLCGLIPYFIAKKQDRMKMAKIALGVCTLAGLILGLILAVPTCLILVIIVYATKKR